MEHLFYSSTAVYRSFVLLLDEAEQRIRAGETPIFLTCDGSLTQYCFGNVSGSRNVCRLCRWMRREGLAALSKPVQNIAIAELLSPDDVRRIREMRFDYRATGDLYDIAYKGVDIGYAAFSHYVCGTRNYDPEWTPELRRFMDGFLRTAVFLTDAIERLLQEHSFASASLFSGRPFDTRPVLRKCVAAGIPTRVFELLVVNDTDVRKVCFPDALPLNVAMQGRWIRGQWERAVAWNAAETMRIGEAFYQHRRGGIRSGDRVYIGRQQKNLLPPSWDAGKKNIVFFSSSEDEFAALDREWDANKLVPTQIGGIRTIVDALHDRQDTCQVYVRIHPNLAGVRFAYHTDLYMLEREYPNVTVISPDSPISTYALIDHADQVVVFGSTVGIEAVYWGKPVILIGPAYYRDLGACYVPKDEAELKDLLTCDLAPKDRLPAIVYGYSILGDVGLGFPCFDFLTFWPDRLLRRVIPGRALRTRILKRLMPALHKVIRRIQDAFGAHSARLLRRATERHP